MKELIEFLIEPPMNRSELNIAAGQEKTSKPLQYKDFEVGAGDRTRTGTLSPAVDFESTTSTNSITPAGVNGIIHEFTRLCKGAGKTFSFACCAEQSIFKET